jgi:hypothetical protein
MDAPTFIAQIDRLIEPDVTTFAPTPNLRVRHLIKDGRHYYLLFNEGGAALETQLHLSAAPAGGLLFDPYTGEQRAFEASTPLQLGRYQLCLLMD